jgi:hypothetical protein
MAARFSLRDLFWLMLVVSVALGWWFHAWRERTIKALNERQAMESELKVAQRVAACADRLEITMIDVSGREFRRYGPFVTNDNALLAEIRRSLEHPDYLERNGFGHNRPLFGGPYLEITLVCTTNTDEYRLRLINHFSIALGDHAYYRAVRQDSSIWGESSRVANGAKSMKWFDRD